MISLLLLGMGNSSLGLGLKSESRLYYKRPEIVETTTLCRTIILFLVYFHSISKNLKFKSNSSDFSWLWDKLLVIIKYFTQSPPLGYKMAIKKRLNSSCENYILF